MIDYVPRRGLRNGHVMTLYAWGRPRRFPPLPPPEDRYFDVEAGTRVLAHCHWQSDRCAHPALLALHGPAPCVEALERRQNIAYEWNFVRGLKARMRRKARSHPQRFRVDRLGEVRTGRQFDEMFTAPHFGFNGASDYYHRASALRVVDRIRVPALV